MHTNQPRANVKSARKTANQTITAAGGFQKITGLDLTVPAGDNFRVSTIVHVGTSSNAILYLACSPDNGATLYSLVALCSLNNVPYPFAAEYIFTAAQVPPGSTLTFWYSPGAAVGDQTVYGAAVGSAGTELTSVASIEPIIAL